MEFLKCYEPGCEFEVEYVCRCTSPGVNSCELHFIKHFKTFRGTHIHESLFFQPYEGTKEAILISLSKEKLKRDKKKKKLIAVFSNNVSGSKSKLSELLNKLELETAEINDFYEKISNIQKISKFEQDPVINILSLNAEMAIEKIKTIIPDSSDDYNKAKLFYEANQEICEKIESLIKEKLEISLKSALLSIEEQNRICNLRNNEVEKLKNAIFDLNDDIQANAEKLKNCKQELKLQRDNDENLLAKQNNEMGKRLEEQITEKLSEEIKGNISELIRESEKTNREIEVLKQEIGLQKQSSTLLLKIDKKAEEHDRIINKQNSDLTKLTNSTPDLIKNMKSLQEWKQQIELNKTNEANMTKSQLKNLEEKFEQQSKLIDETNHKLAEAKEFYTSLRDDAEKFKVTFLVLQGDFQNIAREHENCKQEEKLQRENDKNFLVNQINEIKKKLEEQIKLNSTEKLSKEIKGNISEIMREAEKTNKKIEDLKQEIKKNDTLLLKIDKKAEEHDKIINSQNSDLTVLMNSNSDLIKNMKYFEEWKQEFELNKINEANMVNFQFKNLQEIFAQQSKIINENNHQLVEAKALIIGLKGDAEKFKDTTEKELKNYKQEVTLRSQNDKNFLVIQINEIKKGLEEEAKLKEISISKLISEADKTNKEIEALKNEIAFEKENGTLLLKIKKKTEDYDRIINLQNGDIMRHKNSILDLVKNMQNFEEWKKEIELYKANEENLKSQRNKWKWF